MKNLILTIIIFIITVSVEAKEGCDWITKRKIADKLNSYDLNNLMSVEIMSCDSILLESNFVGLKLFENNKKIHNGIRSEVAVDYPFKEGDHVNYELSIQIPKNFKSDSPNNRWWLVTQWHDQPDKNLGETWDNFPHLSPPVAIYIEERNGIIGMGIIMFGKDKKSWFPFPLGEWVTLNIQFHWSTKEDGLINFKVNSHPEFNTIIAGKNMNNAYQHYLKFGQYRHPDIKLSSQVNFKNLSIFK